MKINNKKIAILFLLISLVLLTSCVVSAADSSNSTISDTQEKVDTSDTNTHSDTSTQSTNTQEQTSSQSTSDTNKQVNSNTQTNSQSTIQNSTNYNTQTTTTKESSSNSQSTNQEQSTTQSTSSQSSTQSVSTNNSASTQSINTDKQLSQEESSSNNQTTSQNSEESEGVIQTNSLNSSQLVNTSKELKTATYTASSYSQLVSTISTIKSSSSTSSNTINLVSGTTYKITSTITWGSSNSKSLTINGNGAVIDGQGKYGFLIVKSGYTITLKNMTIQNCYGNDVMTNDNYYDCAIHNVGGTVIISNTTFQNNKYGIIYNDYNATSLKRGNVTITDCSIINNKYSRYWGMIYNVVSNMTITNTVIRNNDPVDGVCSVIYNQGGTLKLSGCTVSNHSGYDLISNVECYYTGKKETGTITVTNSIFSNNTIGDGVFTNSGTLTITNSNFTNNKAYIDGTNYNGGVVYSYEGTVTISQSIFTNNEGKLGKVLYVNGGTAKVTNNTFIYTYSMNQSRILNSYKAGLISSSNNIYKINLKSTSISIDDTTATTNKSKTYTAYIKASDSSYPTGSVTINIDGKTITSTIGSSGKITFSYTFTKAGTYSVKISYAGNSNYDSSSKTFTVTVTSTVVDTYITTINKNVTVNKSTNLYGYVKGSDNSIPKGSVTISVNGKSYTSSIGSDGYVHVEYTFTNTGSYNVKISYAGSSSYKSSSSTFTVTVSSSIKNTTITTQNKDATANKSTNLYGYIKASDNTIPTGNVTITVNGKNYTSSIGSDGYVHVEYTFTNTGNYNVKISYAGSSSYSSSSSTFTVTVKTNIKNTTITTQNKNATINKSTNLYGYIKASDNRIPTGNVTITVNGKNYTSTIGSDGYVHIEYIFGSEKNYTVTIYYAGSSNYNSSSSTFTVTVKTNIKNTTITTQNKNATINKSTNLYGYIKASDNTIPTGNVTITVNGKTYTSTIGSDGYVHVEYTFTNYGNYNVKISYAGKGNYNSSSSTFTVSIILPKTSTVNSFTQLYDTIEIIKTYDTSGTYTINLVDGNYKITNTINWGSTKGVKNLIINGNGVNLYGSDKQEFLKIASGYTVTLNNIGIINANSSSSAGSILNAGNLTVNNSIFNNSKATTDGGAIYNSGTLNLTNSNFNNCKANNGAAIYNTGKLNITNTNFTQSKVSDRGGAIYNSGTLYITNSNFNNSNATNGGAIYNTGKLNISNINFTKNQASDTGGAIYTTSDGTTTMINTNFTSNDGKKGGAIYVKGKTSINNGNFSKNNATNGGAIYTVGTLTIINSYLNDNTASSYGGAIFSTDSSVISMNSTQLKNNTAPKGGAIYNNGTIYSNASSLYNNLATQGGAIYNLNYLNMTSPSFYYNSAERGGVIFNGGSNAYAYVSNSNCFNNSAVYGGVIFNYNNSYLRISSSTFKYNEANKCEILRNDNATAFLSSCDISYTSSSEGDTILSLNNAKTNLSNIQYTKLNKVTPIIYCDNELIVVGSNATVSGTIRDSRFNLIKSPFTVTITLKGNTLATKTISDGIIEIPITIDDNYIGEYNLTITIKENDNYTSASTDILLMKDTTYSIVVPSITAKNNETVTLTAYITDVDGYRVTNGTATFKLNYNTIKSNGTNILVNITNGVAKYRFKIPDNYSAKDYNLTAVASVNGRRYEYTTTLTISKTDQQLVTDSVVFTTENTVRITGQILDINNHNVTRDVKVAIKINGKTVANTRVIDGKLDITLDLSKYKSGAYTINIVLGENGCYNTAYSNITLIKNLTNSIVIMPTTATHGTNTTLEAYVTDSNGNPQTSGTASFNIQGLEVAKTNIYNGKTELYFNTLEVNYGTYNLTATTKISGKTLTNSTTLIIKDE